jgi:alpha-tubulin suppressor-like RCC1 family protein
MRVSSPRRPFAFAALLLTSVLNLSCGGDSGGGPPEPASVVVTPELDTLFSLNESRIYSAVVLDAVGDPVDGADVTWSSSDTTVLTVGGETGLVTARKNGGATITASSGELSGTANAFVVQVVTSVAVTPGNASLTAVGDTVRFTAVARDSGNSVVTGAQVLWSINDHNVATIDTLGLATAKGPGTVLVSAQAQTRAGYAALGVTQAAAELVFTSVPDSGLAGTPFTKVVQVEVRDSNGQRVRNASLPVTIGVVGGNGAHGMVGAHTITTIDGVTNFLTLGVTRAGTLQLTASAPGITTATSVAFPVAPAAPHHLAVISVKDTMTAGDTLKGRVELQDQYDNQTTASGLMVHLVMRREYSPGFFQFGQLFGSTQGQIVGGKIDLFQGRVTTAGSGWKLAVVAAGYDSAFGGNALIVPGAPVRTIMFFTGIEAISPWVGIGVARSPGLVAQITDQFLNLQPSAPATLLTVGVDYWGWEGEFQSSEMAQQVFGVLQATTVNGVAHFDTIGVVRPAPTYLVATGGGYTQTPNQIASRIYDRHGLTLGEDHGCVMSGGGPYCWGSNDDYQLSHFGPRDSVARPVLNAGAMVSVAAGARHTCGLYADGTAFCWGRDDGGALGRGGAVLPEQIPSPVVTAVKFSQLTGGTYHTCGIGKADSLAYCWGYNASGQLGDSTLTSRNAPVPVAGGHKFAQLSAGEASTCGLEAGETGEIWCWGRNAEGQGGHGLVTPGIDSFPKQVHDGGYLAVQVGNLFACAEYYYNFGITRVRCWGSNFHGRIGANLDSSDPQPLPLEVSALTNIRPGSLTVGTDHACAIATSGFLYCWGRNSDNRFANTGGSEFKSPWQTNVFGFLPEGTEVEAGGRFTCVSLAPAGLGVTAGETQCFGRPNEGQMGNGSTIQPLLFPIVAFH